MNLVNLSSTNVYDVRTVLLLTCSYHYLFLMDIFYYFLISSELFIYIREKLFESLYVEAESIRDKVEGFIIEEELGLSDQRWRKDVQEAAIFKQDERRDLREAWDWVSALKQSVEYDLLGTLAPNG